MPIRPPQSTDEAKLAIETFNAKFEQVAQYSFFRHTKLSASSKFDFITHEGTHTADVPSDEQIDAALLNLRFFFVNNEPSSIDYLPAAYALLSAPQELVDKIKDLVEQWGAWKTLPSVVGGFNNYQFFEVMIYGSRLHRNAHARCDVHDGWMALPWMANVALVDLCSTMHSILAFAHVGYVVNKELLK